MSNVLEIRTLCPSDAGTYQQLRLEGLKAYPHLFYRTYEEEEHKSLDEVSKMIAERNFPFNFMLAAFHSNKLIGMMSFHQYEPYNQNHRGYIYGTCVTESWKTKGVGNQLLVELIQRVKQVKRIEQIDVSCFTLEECTFFQTYGFSLYGVIPEAISVNEIKFNEYLMKLKLN